VEAYRRDGVTRAVFVALFGFGVLNAGLGPALPYLRSVEHISYLVGALHQVAFAIGGGLAGLVAARAGRRPARAVVIRAGLAGAAAAWLVVGYGDVVGATVAAAFVVSLLGTSALVRLWGVLADVHGRWRTVALTEGEVAVSLGSIVAPLMVGGLAATALGWRAAFIAGAATVALAVVATVTVRLPPPTPKPAVARTPGLRRPAPTLVAVVAIVALEFSLSFWLASYLDDSVGLRRGVAVAMVSGLYVANLAGRLLASRLARRLEAARLLAGALLLGLAGLPPLLAATGALAAAVGIALSGAGIGATFPLVSSLHVGVSARGAAGAVGEVLVAAAFGQVLGPLAVGAIAEASTLRAGLLLLPVLILAALAALARYQGLRLARGRPPARSGR
jgi:fucose permease